jgi:pimeloyl-ACP methyl ester carboxylesterase
VHRCSDLKLPNSELEGACRAFAVPKRISASRREVNTLAKGVQACLAVDQERIVFWTYGRGPVVMLIHDWSSRGSRMTRFIKPLVAAGFSVVLFDAPGHGDSSGVCCSVIQIGKVVLKLAEHLGEIHGAIAHSYGSIASLWALSNGLLVHRSVHISGPSSLKALVEKIATASYLNVQQADEFLAWVETFLGIALDCTEPHALSLGLRHRGLIIRDSDESASTVAQSQGLYVAWARSSLLETNGLGQKGILSDPFVIRAAAEFLAVTRQAPKACWRGARSYRLRHASQAR